MLRHCRIYACAILAGALLAAAGFAQSNLAIGDREGVPSPAPEPSATLFGVTRGPGGLPLAGVQVVVRSMEDGANRVLTTDGAGAFTVPDLKPGRYHLVANKDGFVSPPESTVELAANQTLHGDLMLAADNAVASAYNNGAKKNQLTFATDVILFF